MNKDELAKMKDQRVRLRPVAKYMAKDGRELGEFDATWCVGQASERALFLIQQDGPYKFQLGTDSVIEYRTDSDHPDRGFLMLKAQVYMQEGKVTVEPISSHPKVQTRVPIVEGSIPEQGLLPEEVALLCRLDAIGNRCYTPQEIRKGLVEKMPMTKVIYHLDRLVQGNYLFYGPHQMGGPRTYCMDHKGREYLVENGLVE